MTNDQEPQTLAAGGVLTLVLANGFFAAPNSRIAVRKTGSINLCRESAGARQSAAVTNPDSYRCDILASPPAWSRARTAVASPSSRFWLSPHIARQRPTGCRLSPRRIDRAISCSATAPHIALERAGRRFVVKPTELFEPSRRSSACLLTAFGTPSDAPGPQPCATPCALRGRAEDARDGQPGAGVSKKARNR